MTTRISLVTVLYGSAEVLPDFFQSLAEQDYKDWWLYVIDNSPNREAYDLAQKLAMQHGIGNITFIYNNANLGVAKGNNQGIELSRKQGSKYTLLLNNDIYFKPDTISTMLTCAEEHDEALVVPKIYYAGTNRIWMAGGCILPWRGFTRHRGDGEVDVGQYEESSHVGYAPTCFMLVNNKIFDAIGLMDERYFVYFDDTDFVFRALKAEFKLRYLPSAQVNHKVSYSTGGKESPFTFYYSNRNRLFFIRKNFTGIHKVAAVLYFFTTRAVKYVMFDKNQRSGLVKSMRDSLAM